MIERLAYWVCVFLDRLMANANRYKWRQFANIGSDVSIGKFTVFNGEPDCLIIGDKTYINEANISAMSGGRVVIGRHCAIGYRVSIKAVTHDIISPTSDETGRKIIYKTADIYIGNNCWIGDGTFIKEGITLGNDVIVGANSVVTKNVPDKAIVAGVPAIIIAYR